MSANSKFVFTGLEELKVALRNLPKDLAGEAQHLAEAEGNWAVADIRAKYPHKTGNLRAGVSVESFTSRFGYGVIVMNKAKIAFIFENGTVNRSYTTKRGAKHVTGRMPAGNVFVPIMMERRTHLYLQLWALMERNGLLVSGSVGRVAA